MQPGSGRLSVGRVEEYAEIRMCAMQTTIRPPGASYVGAAWAATSVILVGPQGLLRRSGLGRDHTGRDQRDIGRAPRGLLRRSGLGRDH